MSNKSWCEVSLVFKPLSAEDLEKAQEMISELASSHNTTGCWFGDLDTNKDFIPKIYFNESESAESFIKELNNLNFEKNFIEDIKTNNELKESETWFSWKKIFSPFNVGDRFMVGDPTLFPENPDPSKTIIKVMPGRAFGTGTHETTKGCLQILEKSILPQNFKTLDFGCGSAILSIAAFKLGSSEVKLVDNDEDSLVEARQNLKSNYIDSGFTISSELPMVEYGQFDLIFANVVLNVLKEYASPLLNLLKDNGSIVFSGLLVGQNIELLNTILQSGVNVKVTDEVTNGEWVSMKIEKVIE